MKILTAFLAYLMHQISSNIKWNCY